MRPKKNTTNFEVNIVKYAYFLQVKWSFPEDAINNKSSLFKVMVWCQTGGKRLPKSMMTKFSDAIWYCKAAMKCHVASLAHNELKPQVAW